jgi:hypothetical protein
VQLFAKRSTEAARKVLLDEEATRQLIDLQLIEAGWEADMYFGERDRSFRPS